MTRIVRKPTTLAARPLSRLVLAVLVAGALLLGVTSAQARPTPQQKCAAGKNATAGKYAACRESAEAKLAAGGDPSKYTAALDKCESTFSTAWDKLEAKALAASASCPGDDTVIKGQTDAYTDRVAAQVAGVRFKDNLDGTVTDHETGLQWEQKTTTVGSGPNFADPHDVDNQYTWSVTPPYTASDGTAFTQFLATLNAPPCFAGHCDWRLPSEEGRNSPYTGAKELESILLAPYYCGTSPCIDPIFGPTVAFYYWSATTYATDPSFAWFVYFTGGNVFSVGKANFYYVRAVRAGL